MTNQSMENNLADVTLQHDAGLVRTQNRELSFSCIAYNTHRLTKPYYNNRWFLKPEHLVDFLK